MRILVPLSLTLWLAIGAAESLCAQEAKVGLPAKSVSATIHESGSKESPEKLPSGKPHKSGIDSFAMTPEREAAAMTFVKQHHPELAELIGVLKGSRPKEYHKAIRDLYRASERLADLQQIDLQRYDLELKAWRNQSRLQLLAARVQMAPGDEKLQTELKAELTRQYDLRLEVLQLDRQRLADRAAKLDTQIERLKAGRDSQVERQMGELLGKRPPTKAAKPAKKP